MLRNLMRSRAETGAANVPEPVNGMRGFLLFATVFVGLFLGRPAEGTGQTLFERFEDAGENLLLTPREALLEIFPKAVSLAVRAWRPTAVERKRLEQQLDRRLFVPVYHFLLMYDAGDRFLGYGLITEERGKYRPITFMVGIAPGPEVKGAAVMVYRENHGGEVKRERFLVQYRGKTLTDPIRINRDIINISGATISVRSMNRGVRKVLALVEAAFGAEPPDRAGLTELRPLSELP